MRCAILITVLLILCLQCPGLTQDITGEKVVDENTGPGSEFAYSVNLSADEMFDAEVSSNTSNIWYLEVSIIRNGKTEMLDKICGGSSYTGLNHEVKTKKYEGPGEYKLRVYTIFNDIDAIGFRVPYISIEGKFSPWWLDWHFLIKKYKNINMTDMQVSYPVTAEDEAPMATPVGASSAILPTTPVTTPAITPAKNPDTISVTPSAEAPVAAPDTISVATPAATQAKTFSSPTQDDARVITPVPTQAATSPVQMREVIGYVKYIGGNAVRIGVDVMLWEIVDGHLNYIQKTTSSRSNGFFKIAYSSEWLQNPDQSPHLMIQAFSLGKPITDPVEIIGNEKNSVELICSP